VESSNRESLCHTHRDPLQYANCDPLQYANCDPLQYANCDPLQYANCNPLQYANQQILPHTETSMTTSSQTESLDIATARRALYDALSDEEATLADKQRRAVTIGCRYLDLPEGHIKRIDDPEEGAVVTRTNETAALIAEETELAHPGYCATVLQRDASLAIANAVEAGYDDDPGYTDHGVACYIGSTITVDGEPYGTVCFGAPEPRDREFSPAERTFVELLAEMLGRRFAEAEYVDAVEQTRRKYEALVETATDAVVLVDTATREIVEANESAAALVDVADSDALVGRDYAALVTADTADSLPETWEWLTDTGSRRERLPDGTQIAVLTADGECPVTLEAETVALDGREYAQVVVRDITDRRRRERRVEAIFDQTHQFTGLLSPDGTLLEANGTALAFAGVERDEIVGEQFVDCPWWDVDEETRERLEEALTQAARGEFVRYETPVAGVTGERVIDFSIRPITDDDGEVELLIPEGRDVTARVERDRQLAVLSRVLRHNFRNDISVIDAFAEAITDGVVAEPETAAQRIQSQASALSTLVGRYREAVELLNDPPEQTAVPVDGTVRDVAASIRSDYPDATVEVTTPTADQSAQSPPGDSEPPTPITATAVPEIDRAVEELLINAVEHTGPSPTVGVEVSAGPETVSVAVTDEGAGLPDAERRVLTGQQSIGPLGHADGVGLWLVYWIVDLSDGTITVDTDDGTTIRVTLPRAER
jgi:PAS domain S-box-containing protein